MDGSPTIARCEEISTVTLKSVFDALFEHHVRLEQMLLKTNMIVSGKTCPKQADPDEVAFTTLRCFRSVVPAAVPGIVFLSGGQSAEMATLRLNAICRVTDGPWRLSFSFGRALQSPALKIWRGLSGNIPAAQKALHDDAQRNSLAVRGK
jgi:fructose-bisphosphate aldolase class I